MKCASSWLIRSRSQLTFQLSDLQLCNHFVLRDENISHRLDKALQMDKSIEQLVLRVNLAIWFYFARCFGWKALSQRLFYQTGESKLCLNLIPSIHFLIPVDIEVLLFFYSIHKTWPQVFDNHSQPFECHSITVVTWVDHWIAFDSFLMSLLTKLFHLSRSHFILSLYSFSVSLWCLFLFFL